MHACCWSSNPTAPWLVGSRTASADVAKAAAVSIVMKRMIHLAVFWRLALFASPDRMRSGQTYERVPGERDCTVPCGARHHALRFSAPSELMKWIMHLRWVVFAELLKQGSPFVLFNRFA